MTVIPDAGRRVVDGIRGLAGAWTNVTPPDMLLGPDDTSAGVGQNFGCQGVRADPRYAGVFYAGATYQALWKSTDWGLTWTKVSVSGSDIFANGRLNLVIAPDGSYMLSTCLYPINGFSNGAWRSTDSGLTWSRNNIGFDNGDDVGRMAIDPTSALRVVASAHSGTDHMWESRDGGVTWTDQGAMGGATNAEIIWLDDDTLLAISDGDNIAGNGTWRGVRSGSVWPWTWTWTSKDTQQHWHGTAQAFVEGNGNVWTGGGFGIRKSTDNGLTWTQVDSMNSGGIVGTPTTLYATSNYASSAGFGPNLAHSLRSGGGTTWIADTNPGAMNNGWLYAAIGSDAAKRYAVIGGCWNAGIWRYVE